LPWRDHLRTRQGTFFCPPFVIIRLTSSGGSPDPLRLLLASGIWRLRCRSGWAGVGPAVAPLQLILADVDSANDQW